MLQSMRNQARSWIVIVLFGLLILSFAVWGIGDIFRGGGVEASVAEVGDREIATTDFLREYQTRVQELSRQTGNRLTPELIAALNIGPAVADQMASRVLFDIAREDLGLAVPDAAVRRTVVSDPVFNSSLTGRFDEGIYRNILARIGHTPTSWEAAVRGDLAREQLIGTVVAASPVPEILAGRLHAWRGERRIVVAARIPDEAMTLETPDDARLRAWHADNEGDFMAPEYRDLSVLLVLPADLMDEIVITPEELRDLYEYRLDEFGVPERRRVLQMLFNNQEDAAAAAEEIAAGRAFDDVATDSANRQQDLSLGQVERGDLFPEIAEAVFALQEGGVSAPVESLVGWHLLQVTEIEAGSVEPFEAVRDRLLADERRDQAPDLVFERANEAEDLLAGGASLEEAAVQTGLRFLRLEGIDSRGNRRDGMAHPDLPAIDGFLRTAFATGEGLESDRMETGEGETYLLVVDAVIPPDVRPFEEARVEVLDHWTFLHRRDLALAAAEELINAVAGGSRRLEDIAAVAGYEANETLPFTRDGAGGGDQPPVPPTAFAGVFEAERGEAITAQTIDAVQVLQVREILPPDPETRSATLTALREEAAAAIAEDLLAQYADALRRRWPVELDLATIARALDPGSYGQ